MLIDINDEKKVLYEEVGGKAYNLIKIVNLGLDVPPAIVIPASIIDRSRNDSIFLNELAESIYEHNVIKNGTFFAVRSSGIGEDGNLHSYAGIFESNLQVPKLGLTDAINQVVGSLFSNRSRIYQKERQSSVSAMAIVIQHMIESDYAGVIFTSGPIVDDRIAIMEIVSGLGENLVSNKKSPTTLRINKITGLVRKIRNGSDVIPDKTLFGIVEKMMPIMEIIERFYGHPVDIEWAIVGERLYVLQARPITTK